MIGKTINNYIIERKLGEGGMGNVYFARHNRVDRIVAIKVLHQNLFANESIRNRFKNEANALIKLGHPNIVKIYDYVEQDNFACLIMEYIEGFTLDDYISKVSGPLVTSKALHIICSILDAVQYAHDSNIFHRDIKPGNIMVSGDGTKVRIMDFGIAKMINADNFKNTHANTQLGTPFYMSPEQVKGLPYTGSSDIYSLGVTLFEMVTGKCPYQSITNLFELQNKIVQEPLPPTGIYYPDVSPQLQAAIIRATQKKPERRFASCSDFKNYLLSDEKPGHDLYRTAGNTKETVTSLPASKEITEQQVVSLQKRVAETTIPANKISAPNLLEAYPVKERKNGVWIFSVVMLLIIAASGLYYYYQNKNITGEVVKSTSDTTQNLSFNGLGEIDSTYKGVNTIIDSGNSDIIPIADSSIKEETNSAISASVQDKTVKIPEQIFKYLDRQQVISDLDGRKMCSGIIYSGENQDLDFSDGIPGKADQKSVNVDESISVYVDFMDNSTGVRCKVQVTYKKENTGFVFQIASPL